MQAEKPRAQIGNGPVRELWRRAPAFRGLVYVAVSVSFAGVIALSVDREHSVTLVSSSHEAAQVAPQPIQSGTPVTQQEALPVPQQAVQGRESERVPLAVQKPMVAAQSGPSAADEDAERARCHPHLIPISASMPQIDVSQMADPSIGHIKVHFWVNGAGLVTREALTATSYATAAERQAELDFTKGLTFTVPNTAECRVREMELIGDYFEMKNSAGQWVTYVKLYPRLSFDTDGVVRSRE
jgi:hypothetical protein